MVLGRRSLARSTHQQLSRCLSSTAEGSKTTHFGFEDVPIHEKQKRVASVFTNVASSYDSMNDAMSLGVHRLWKDSFTSRCGLSSSAIALREFNASNKTLPPQTLDILDVAGGTGDISFRFVDQMDMKKAVIESTVKDCCTVTVSDINPGMLAVGKERAIQKYGHELIDSGNLKFVEGNAEELPFPDNSFDLYTISFGLRNVTDVPKALRDAYRVLKPGGRFLCCEFSEPVNETFRQVYDAYSFNVIPKMGEVVANDRESYQYLVESIRKFYRQVELEEEVRKAGFVNTSYENYTGGIVAFHEGWKM